MTSDKYFKDRDTKKIYIVDDINVKDFLNGITYILFRQLGTYNYLIMEISEFKKRFEFYKMGEINDKGNY